MTAQKHPLEVEANVSLYPFSHRTLFQKDDDAHGHHHGGPMDTSAPLPSQMYGHHSGNVSDRTLSPPNNSMNGTGLTPPSMNGGNGPWTTPPNQHHHIDMFSNPSTYMTNGM